MTVPDSSKFTLAVVVVMALGIAIAAALALSSAGSGAVVPATRQPAPVTPSEIRAKPTPVNLDEIREEAVRAFFDDQGNFFSPDQRLAQIAKKHDGGFGGYSFHEVDRSHVYVYVVDTSETESAEAAFRQAYNGRRSVTQITPVQGQFRFDQLVEWFPVVDRALLANDIHPTTGAVMEICNRIRFGLRYKYLIADARRVVDDLGIPQEAVVFKQMNPVLLGHGNAREPLLRPVVDRFNRLFQSEADDERSFSYGPGWC